MVKFPFLPLVQGARIDFRGQVENYKSTVSQVVNLLGDENKAANYLSKCIFSIGMGSNDYLNNYFMPAFYSTGSQFTPEQYADLLIQDYAPQLRVSVQLLLLFTSSSHLTSIYSRRKSICNLVYQIGFLTLLLMLGFVQLWSKKGCCYRTWADWLQPE